MRLLTNVKHSYSQIQIPISKLLLSWGGAVNAWWHWWRNFLIWSLPLLSRLAALHAKPKLCLTESENLPVNPDLLRVPMYFCPVNKVITQKNKQKSLCFSTVKQCGSIIKSILNSVCSFLSTEIHMGSSPHHRITPQRKGSSVPTSASFVYEQGSCREGDVTHPQILSRRRAEPEPEPGDQCSSWLSRDPDTDSPLLVFRENKPKNLSIRPSVKAFWE